MTTRPTRFRDNVGAILRRPADGHILLCERLKPAGIWQLPQGGVDPGESKEEAIWRELGEELGLSEPRSVCRLLGHGPPTRYEFAPNYDAPIARTYRGQEQTIFVFDFLGTDDMFRLDAFEVPEFGSLQWVTIAQALEIFWESKREPFEATLGALPHLFSL